VIREQLLKIITAFLEFSSKSQQMNDGHFRSSDYAQSK